MKRKMIALALIGTLLLAIHAQAELPVRFVGGGLTVHPIDALPGAEFDMGAILAQNSVAYFFWQTEISANQYTNSAGDNFVDAQWKYMPGLGVNIADKVVVEVAPYLAAVRQFTGFPQLFLIQPGYRVGIGYFAARSLKIGLYSDFTAGQSLHKPVSDSRTYETFNTNLTFNYYW